MNDYTRPRFQPTNRSASVFTKRQWLYKLTAGVLVACVIPWIVSSAVWGQANTTINPTVIDPPNSGGTPTFPGNSPDITLTPLEPDQWKFQHTRRGASSSHTDEIMEYITWDGSKWTVKIVDGQFLHAPNGDWNRAHRADILNYRTWDGAPWTARMVDGEFLHALNGDFNQAHHDTILNYRTWDGSEWTTSLVAEGNL